MQDDTITSGLEGMILQQRYLVVKHYGKDDGQAKIYLG